MVTATQPSPATTIKYVRPTKWDKYDHGAVLEPLARAKAAVLSLRTVPYQRAWVEELQEIQLKREIAGTSRIEGADFTEGELDAALKNSTEDLHTRSQRQAHAAMKAYKWIAAVPDDRPIDGGLICELHTIIVTGADDDHCPPGVLRQQDANVTFGAPRHRGVEGGDECELCFGELLRASRQEFTGHDPLIHGLMLHYHFAAMHPFLDGNGRTARALEALMLQRAGLRVSCFIPMSNYYYDEKNAYLFALAETRRSEFDLTAFLVFGLKGVEVQCHRLLTEIQSYIQKALFKDLMFDLFHRLRTPKRRVIIERQLEILKLLLRRPMLLSQLSRAMNSTYESMGSPWSAMVRDLNELIRLGAIKATAMESANEFELDVNLSWPMEITETEFFKRIKEMPKAKSHAVLQI